MAYDKNDAGQVYGKFIPTIWSSALEKELEKNLVFGVNTTREYEGEVKKIGDTVKILGTNAPTIYSLARENAGGSINPAEEIGGYEQLLHVHQIRYFHYKISKIDKAQSIKGLMERHATDTGYQLADAVDQYLASIHVPDANNLNKKADELAQIEKVEATDFSKDTVLSYLDDAVQIARENNIPTGKKMTATMTPKAYRALKDAYQHVSEIGLNNEVLEKGQVGKYSNLVIKMSNNTYVDGDGKEHIQIKTDDAIAYVHGMTETFAYEPQDAFTDAVKGYILFDAKVVRPKEIIILEATHA